MGILCIAVLSETCQDFEVKVGRWPTTILFMLLLEGRVCNLVDAGACKESLISFRLGWLHDAFLQLNVHIQQLKAPKCSDEKYIYCAILPTLRRRSRDNCRSSEGLIHSQS